MKCKECELFKGECTASDLVEQKTFKDGSCGCKYKTKAIAEIIEIVKSRTQKEIPREETKNPIETECSDDEFIVKESNAPVFEEGDTVRCIYDNQDYKVLYQTEDRIVCKVENKTNGMCSICTADLLKVNP